jgi:X-X-X-Leu-X-X-Gly heptad repeat protein
MATNVTFADHLEAHSDDLYGNREARSSGVAWAAVFGGAVVAAALYLILLALGAGLGLSAVSPWSNVGVSAQTVGTGAIVWLILIEILASALGGYLTGRLRTKWALIHTDEVYFRDTANGFLAWAVALVISVVFLASGAASMVGGVAQLESGATAASETDPNAYFIDTLFRSDRPGAESKDGSAQAEAGVILANSLRESQMPAADQAYLARLVASRAGITLPEAQQRVSDVVVAAKQAEDTARKVTAHLLLWFFLAVLMGAFSASYAATIGGRQRDQVKAV